MARFEQFGERLESGAPLLGTEEERRRREQREQLEIESAERRRELVGLGQITAGSALELAGQAVATGAEAVSAAGEEARRVAEEPFRRSLVDEIDREVLRRYPLTALEQQTGVRDERLERLRARYRYELQRSLAPSAQQGPFVPPRPAEAVEPAREAGVALMEKGRELREEGLRRVAPRSVPGFAAVRLAEFAPDLAAITALAAVAVPVSVGVGAVAAVRSAIGEDGRVDFARAAEAGGTGLALGMIFELAAASPAALSAITGGLGTAAGLAALERGESPESAIAEVLINVAPFVQGIRKSPKEIERVYRTLIANGVEPSVARRMLDIALWSTKPDKTIAQEMIAEAIQSTQPPPAPMTREQLVATRREVIELAKLRQQQPPQLPTVSDTKRFGQLKRSQVRKLDRDIAKEFRRLITKPPKLELPKQVGLGVAPERVGDPPIRPEVVKAVQSLAPAEESSYFQAKDGLLNLRRKLSMDPIMGSPLGARLPKRLPQSPHVRVEGTDKLLVEVQPGRWLRFGPKTNEELELEIASLGLDEERILEIARWYESTAEVLRDIAPESAPMIAELFAFANQNQAPAAALIDALGIVEEMTAPSKIRRGTVPSAAEFARRFKEALGSHAVGGPKLSDMADIMAGRRTRTFMGNDPRGGKPTVVDIHVARALGYLDSTLAAEWIRNPRTPADVVEVLRNSRYDHAGVPTFAQYEHAASRIQAFTDYLNAKNWLGKNDWEPHQVQAVLWYLGAQKYSKRGIGLQPGEFLDRNTWTIDVEAVIDSPSVPSQAAAQYQQIANMMQQAQGNPVRYAVIRRLFHESAAKAGYEFADFVGIPRPMVRVGLDGIGYWEGTQNPSLNFNIVATPERALLWADAWNVGFDQFAVVMGRYLRPWRPGEKINFDKEAFAVSVVSSSEKIREKDVRSLIHEVLSREIAPQKPFEAKDYEGNMQQRTTYVPVGHGPLRSHDNKIGLVVFWAHRWGDLEQTAQGLKFTWRMNSPNTLRVEGKEFQDVEGRWLAQRAMELLSEPGRIERIQQRLREATGIGDLELRPEVWDAGLVERDTGSADRLQRAGFTDVDRVRRIAANALSQVTSGSGAIFDLRERPRPGYAALLRAQAWALKPKYAELVATLKERLRTLLPGPGEGPRKGERGAIEPALIEDLLKGVFSTRLAERADARLDLFRLVEPERIERVRQRVDQLLAEGHTVEDLWAYHLRITQFSPEPDAQLSEDLALLKVMAEKTEELARQARRGDVVTWEEIEENAATLFGAGGDVRAFLDSLPDTSRLPEQILAYGNLIKAQTDLAHKAYLRVKQGDRSPEAISELYDHLLRLGALSAAFEGRQAEVARALNVMRKVRTGILADLDLRALLETTPDSGDLVDVDRVLSVLEQVPWDQPGILARTVRSLQKRGASLGWLWEYLKAIKLTSPRTHARNILGTALMLPIRAAEDYAQVAVNATRNLARGRLELSEEALARAYMWPMLYRQFPGALRAFWRTLVRGRSLDTITKLEESGHIKAPIVRQATQAVFRTLEAEDAFFKWLIAAARLRARIAARLHKQGVFQNREEFWRAVDREFEERIFDWKRFIETEDPEELASLRVKLPRNELFKDAIRMAREFTFTEEPSTVARLTDSLARRTGLKAFLLFTNTAMQVWRQGFERIPGLNVLPLVRRYRRLVAEGKMTAEEAQDAVIARLMVSGALGYFVWQATQQGWIQPSEWVSRSKAGMRDAVRTLGVLPQSFIVRGRSISFRGAEPLSMVLGTVSDAWALVNRAPEILEDKLFDQAITLMALSIARNMLEASFASSFADLISAIETPEQFAGQLAGELETLPLPQVLTTINDLRDPYVRESRRALFGAARRFIPGLAGPVPDDPEEFLRRPDLWVVDTPFGQIQALPPAQDFWGRPVLKTMGVVVPFARQRIQDDPILAEIVRLRMNIEKPRDEIAGIKLDGWDYFWFVYMSRQHFREILSRIMARDSYWKAPPPVRRKLIRNVYEQVNTLWRTRWIAAMLRSGDLTKEEYLRAKGLLEQEQAALSAAVEGVIDAMATNPPPPSAARAAAAR